MRLLGWKNGKNLRILQYLAVSLYYFSSLLEVSAMHTAEKLRLSETRYPQTLLSRCLGFSYLDGERERFYVFSSGCFNGGQMEGKMKESSHLYKSFLDGGRLRKGESAAAI